MASMKHITLLEKFPEEFFTIHPTETHRVFCGPTLIHLKGKIERPIFISTLLHGNETTGFFAIQEYFKNKTELNRSVIILIGNTRAAEQGIRKLPEQVDFNRVWSLKDRDESCPEAWDIAREVIDYCKKNNIFFAVDIHNNTGRNPFYGCVNKIDKSHLHLASQFSKEIVFFTEPHEVLSMNFSDFCPATTIEVGLPGLPTGIEYTVNYLDKLMKLEKLDSDFDTSQIILFHSIARIKVDHDCTIDFDEDESSENNFSLLKEFDANNFITLPEGTFLGYKKGNSDIFVIDNMGENVSGRFLEIKDSKIYTRHEIIPSMFTKLIQVLKDDCLGYIMERVKI